MDFLLPKRRYLANIRSWTIVVVLAFTAMGVAGQTTPSTHLLPPPEVQEKVSSDPLPTAGDTDIDNNAADVETQRPFDELRNDLRRELLDDRADTINWWLTIALIVLAVISVVAALGVYFGFSRFREIETEAKRYTEEVKELNKQAKEDAQQIGRERERITKANILGNGPDQAKQVEEASRDILQKPAMSLLDRAIAEAFSLQRAGKIEEAIENGVPSLMSRKEATLTLPLTRGFPLVLSCMKTLV